MQDLLDTYGIPYKLGVSIGFINICCPFCGDEKFHMGFSLKDKYFTCFKCGWHSVPETLKLLTGIDNMPLPENDVIAERYSPVAGAIKLPGELELSSRARKYLKKRGYELEYLLRKFQLQDGGYIGDYKFRIIIPVYKNKRLITFTSRTYVNEEPRYKHLSKEKSILDCKQTLYNIDNCKDSAIVLEGPADVWRWGDGAVATFGTSVSEPQMELLRTKFKKLHFIFDNEDEAQKKAKQCAINLSVYGVKCFVHRLLDKNDIGDCTDEEINEIKAQLL